MQTGTLNPVTLELDPCAIKLPTKAELDAAEMRRMALRELVQTSVNLGDDQLKAIEAMGGARSKSNRQFAIFMRRAIDIGIAAMQQAQAAQPSATMPHVQ